MNRQQMIDILLEENVNGDWTDEYYFEKDNIYIVWCEAVETLVDAGTTKHFQKLLNLVVLWKKHLNILLQINYQMKELKNF